MNNERRVRLLRRWARMVDYSLGTVEAIRSGQVELAADREQKMLEAATVLAETLGYMLIHDREDR